MDVIGPFVHEFESVLYDFVEDQDFSDASVMKKPVVAVEMWYPAAICCICTV